MKRFGNLYHRIYDIDNLYLAYSKAKKGKGKTYGVIQFEKDLDNTFLAQRIVGKKLYHFSIHDFHYT